MPSNRSFSLSRVLPGDVLDLLGNVLQQTAQAVEQEVFVVTEASLSIECTIAEFPDRFFVVVSHQFSSLLLANREPTESLHYQAQLTFAPAAIATFLTQLSRQLQHDSRLAKQLHQASQQLHVNNPELQSEFTLRLAELLLARSPHAFTNAAPENAAPETLQSPQPLEQHVIDRTQELHDALLVAQTANRAKTEFLAAMSHELRTPLTCVIGMADTLLRVMAMKPDTYPLQPQKQQEYLKLIKRSGEHLLELVNDILDVSQVEAGKGVLNVKPFSLSQVAHQSLQLLQEGARSKGIKLSLKPLQRDLNPDSAVENDSFTADPRRVGQILLNLLSNAIKFTPEGGHVTLRFGNTHNIAMFQVEDTGIGIAESERPLLFQKFQQLDSSLTRTYEGTGLGLALTKQLVELHDGRIEVNSTVGVGSTFTVWLPAPSIAQPLDQSDSALPAIATVPPLPVGERVVLIEDHDETALLICDLLTAAACQVVWMVEFSTAMRQIELLHPCLVIANMQLERHSDKIIHFVRQHPSLKTTKILALTSASPANHLSANHLPEGADDYLTKPIDPYELLGKVAALVGRT